MVNEIVQRVPRVVCVDWEWPGVPSVHFDRQNASFQATTHLLDSGRTHIAYIGPEDKRIAGYQQALWGRGIMPTEVYIGDESRLAYEQCSKLIQSGVPLD